MLQIGANEYLYEGTPDPRALFNALASGRIFTVTFRERTKPETRVMNCRTGVKKFLKGGGELKFNPFERGLVPVYDIRIKEEGKGYRFFNVENLLSIKVDGVTIHFEKPNEIKENTKSETEDSLLS